MPISEDFNYSPFFNSKSARLIESEEIPGESNSDREMEMYIRFQKVAIG